jgi:cytochrome c-type biogenesis protein CcmF
VFRARVLAVMSLLALGFLSFMIFTSNPFERMVPPTADGNDLNPLLQDIGLIIHPPMLYMGYVGMAVPFAFAVAALLENHVDQQWVRFCRPWTNIAWAFLTLGIALGSWWAYYELGWGGWWFWDPVENASFLPWLAGAALIHSQAVTEKRGTFRGWTMLLSISVFSLSLLGTFLVRSGVITSVHAFASDPTRGMFVLAFLGAITGGALLLFALRGARVRVLSQAALVSKETLLLVNNILLISACVLVLAGTLFPLFAEALNFGKYSVGAPWFGKMFALFSVPLLLLVPLGAFCRWNEDRLSQILTPLLPALAAAVLATATAWLMRRNMPLKTILGLLVAFWVMAGTLAFLWRRWQRKAGERFTLEMLGMSAAHLGLGLWLAGVVLVETLSVERDVRLNPNESVEVGPYTVKMLGVAHRSGPNFEADRGRFEVYRDGKLLTELNPEKRAYRRGQVMTEAAIRPHIFGDVYVALGEPLDEQGNAWAVRAYHKPFIRLIWLGAFFMAFGGVLAAAERRLRMRFAERIVLPRADAPAAANSADAPAGASA